MIRQVKRELKKRLYTDSFAEGRWLKANPYHTTPDEWAYTAHEGRPTVGILYDIAQEHQHYMIACHEIQVNYKVIDIRGSDWIARIHESGCKVFLVWPTIYKPIQKQFWDERLRILVEQVGAKVFPSLDLLWLYESKRKSRDWLNTNGYPHPKTDVFFTEKKALDFVRSAAFPLVLKTDQGAGSSGVFILRSQQAANNMIRKAFRRGIKLKNRGDHDRHQGYVILQEYLPDCKEWRLIRVGESYFCRLKKKKGDFHSGSNDIVWAEPPSNLLDQTREISEQFEIPNINVDFFETTEGEFVINELHALWGGKVLKDEKLEGRYLYDAASNTWRFEHGDFFGHRCAELRIQWLIDNKWV